jgi:chitodextrinase
MKILSGLQLCFVEMGNGKGVKTMKSELTARLLIAAFAALLLWSAPAFSVTYYIDPVNGDDTTGEPDKIDKPYKRLKDKFRYLLKPGDVVYLRGGLYASDYFWAGSTSNGAEGNPITIQAYPGEIPVFTGQGYYKVIFTLGGHRNYILDGIHFENTQGDAVVAVTTGADHIIVRNCHFKTHIWGNMLLLEMSSYNRVENCTFDTVGSPEVEGTGSHIYIRGGHHNLIQDNYLTRAGHSSILVEHYTADTVPPYMNVIRNNTIEQHWGTGISLGLDTNHTLVEGNTILYSGEGVPEHEKSNLHLRSELNIVRNNVTALTGSTTPKKHYGIEMEAYSFQGKRQHCRNNRFYNNLVYKSGNAGFFITQRHDTSLTGNKVINNIVYHNRVGGADAYYSTSSVVFDTYHTYAEYKWPVFPNNNFFFNNLFLHADAGGDLPGYTPYFYYNGDGGWTKTLAQTEAAFPETFRGNIELNPRFIDEANLEFHLLPDSPAIDTGAFLTRTLEAGTDTVTVRVEDSLFFSDGFGIVEPDRVQIGPNPPVSLASVDYDNHILTLKTRVSFPADQPVSLPYHGPAPDLGPFEYEGIPYNRTPVLLTIGNRQGEETKLLEFQVEGVDPDRDPVTYSASGLPPGAKFNPSTRMFQWTPTTGQAGSYPGVAFTIADATSSDSETITITVHPEGADLTPPAVSSIQAAVDDFETASITWNTDEPADSRVDYGTTTAYGSAATLASERVTAHSVRLTDLQADTTYHYRVSSQDEAGNRSQSQDLSFKTPVRPADTTPPQILSSTVRDVVLHGATLSWQTDEDTASYALCDANPQNLTDEAAQISAACLNRSATEHRVCLTGLAEGTTYYYRLVASDTTGNRGQTETPLSFQTLSSSEDEVSISFQSGVNGYDGCQNFELQGSNPNAHVFSDYYLSVNSDNVTDPYTLRPFLRFDLSSLPPNVCVISAVLELTHSLTEEGMTVSLHPLTLDIDFALATRNTIDGVNPWSGGATGGGKVEDPDNDFADVPDATLKLGAPGVYRYEVTSTVNAWVSGELSNNGWLMRSSKQLTRFRPRKYATVSERPKLLITNRAIASAPPETPEIAPFDSPYINRSPVILSGKMSNNTAAILVNGSAEGVTLISFTFWEARVALQPGSNTISVVARGQDGQESAPATVHLILDQTSPTGEVITNE